VIAGNFGPGKHAMSGLANSIHSLTAPERDTSRPSRLLERIIQAWLEDETYQSGLDRRVNPDQDEVLRISESARAARLGSLPTAGGGIARAAFAAAKRARLDVRTLLKNSDLTLLQAEKPDIRIPVKSQIKFLNAVASALPDDLLGVHLAQSVDLRELGLLY
jgi:hypothetical protein